jgi:hypothetical protein
MSLRGGARPGAGRKRKLETIEKGSHGGARTGAGRPSKRIAAALDVHVSPPPSQSK